MILGHGIGGQKDMALHGFADRFASNGLAAVIFDYRTFGGSDGEPRHWVSPKRHLEDWTSTIQYVQVRPELDIKACYKLQMWATTTITCSRCGQHSLSGAWCHRT